MNTILNVQSGFGYDIAVNGDCGVSAQTADQVVNPQTGFSRSRVKENIRLQIRGDLFNLFNRARFGFPGTTVGTPNYGVIESASDARIIQLGVRLAF